VAVPPRTISISDAISAARNMGQLPSPSFERRRCLFQHARLNPALIKIKAAEDAGETLGYTVRIEELLGVAIQYAEQRRRRSHE
jgi:hypothetical protein